MVGKRRSSGVRRGEEGGSGAPGGAQASEKLRSESARHETGSPAPARTPPAAGHGSERSVSRVPTTCILVIGGLLLFGLMALTIITLLPSNAELKALHSQPLPVRAAEFATVGFATSIASQLLNTIFEDSHLKMQHNLLVIYINSVAAFASLICSRRFAPVIMDPFGISFNPVRWLSWLATTPVMVYTLSLMSSFSWRRTLFAISLDVLMLFFGAGSQLPVNWQVSWTLFLTGGITFVGLVQQMWMMFATAMDQEWASKRNSELKATRVLTVVTWCTFPLVWILRATDKIGESTAEALYEAGNFLGKSMFATTLMHDNFISINERRSMATKAAEEANRETLLEELRELVAQKDSLLSSTSHELKTPLTGIIGLAESILNGNAGPINEHVKGQVNTMLLSARRLLSLIQNMLDAAAMQRKSVHLNLTHVDVDSIVNHVVELTRPLLHMNVKLKHTQQKNLPKLRADEGRVTQILHNLLANAAKFTIEGYVAIRVRLADSSMKFVVEDTGPGIPKDKEKQIFLPFQQLDPSTTRKHGGTGLGLNLVQQLVHAHHGTVQLESQAGEGSKFIIELPLDPESCDTQANALADTAESTQGGTRRKSQEGETLPEVQNREDQSSKAEGQREPSEDIEHTKHDYHNTNADIGLLDGARRRNGSTDGDEESDDSHTESEQDVHIRPLSENHQHPSMHSHPQQMRDTSQGSSLDSAGGDTSGGAMTEETHHAHSARRHPSEFFTHKDVFGTPQVLSVDDDPVNQMVIDSLLGSKGYEVTCALNAQEALKCLDEQSVPPDCVLLDVMMPEVNGIELAADLRERFSTTRVPIMMISAKSQEESIVEAFHSGANDFITKPFKGEELGARIQSQIGMRHAWKAETKTLAKNIETEQQQTSQQQPQQLVSRESTGEEQHERRFGRSISNVVDRLSESQPQQPMPNQDSIMTVQLSVLVAEVVEWQQLLCSVGASSAVSILGTLMQNIDQLLSKFNLFHIETYGDFMMIVSGFDSQQRTEDCRSLMDFACQLMHQLKELDLGEEARKAGIHRLSGRIGVDVGECCADAVGHKKPKWHVYGDVVATATDLKSRAPPDSVHTSESVQERLRDSYSFEQYLKREQTFLLQESFGNTDSCNLPSWSNEHEQNVSPLMRKRLSERYQANGSQDWLPTNPISVDLAWQSNHSQELSSQRHEGELSGDDGSPRSPSQCHGVETGCSEDTKRWQRLQSASTSPQASMPGISDEVRKAVKEEIAAQGISLDNASSKGKQRHALGSDGATSVTSGNRPAWDADRRNSNKLARGAKRNDSGEGVREVALSKGLSTKEADSLVRNGVTEISMLPLLTDEEFRELGISIGARVKLREAGSGI